MASRNRAYARPLSPALACALCAIILALGVLVLPRAAFAMPAFPGLKSATQPEGTQVSYYLHGDEHFSYFTAADGSLLQQDPETGALCYVNLNPDGTLSLGVPAQSATPLANGTVATSAALSSTDAKAAYAALGGSVLNAQARSHFPLLSLNDTNVFCSAKR